MICVHENEKKQKSSGDYKDGAVQGHGGSVSESCGSLLGITGEASEIAHIRARGVERWEGFSV